MDFRAFKKVSDDGKVVTLQHEKGHEVRIVKHAVDRKTRNALQALPTQSRHIEHEKEPENEKLAVANRYASGGSVKKYAEGTSDAPVPDPTANLDDSANATNAKSGSPITINVGAPQTPQLDPATIATPAAAASEESLPSVDVDPRSAQLQQLPTPSAGASTAANALFNGPPVTDAALAGREPTDQERDAAKAAQSDGAYVAGARPQNYIPQASSSQSNALLAPEPIPQPVQPPRDSGQQAFQKVTDAFNQRMATWDKAHQDLVNDITSNKIDPDRLWNQKSGFDKVASTIGLLLGGVTGNKGLIGTYGRLVQNEIDKDIASQVENLGTKKTLLDAHLKQFGNIKDAADAARMDMLSASQAQLAKSQSFATNLSAQKTALELQQYQNQIKQQNSLRHALQAGGDNPDVRAAAVRMLVPEKQQEAAYKELKETETAKRLGENALDSFDQVDHMFGAGVLAPHQRDALIEPVLAQMVRDSEGRVTPQDTKMIKELFPRATDVGDTRSVKRQKLATFLGEKMSAPILSANFVPVPKINTTRSMARPASWPGQQ